MRVRSTETKLREALRELRQAHADKYAVRADRDAYRARATKAEQEVAEWKGRFDALLARTPPSTPMESADEYWAKNHPPAPLSPGGQR